MSKATKIRSVEFVGSGIAGCPLIHGNSRDLKCGAVYAVDSVKEEAGMLLLRVSDAKGKIIGLFPAQWFNPLSRRPPLAN